MTKAVRIVPSATLARWDVKNILLPRWLRPPSEMARFGDVAKRRIEPNESGARYGSVHFDGSISLRPESVTIKGATFIAHSQDLVFSRIDARNGAIGVVSRDFGRIAFTNEFPVYDVAASARLLPSFAQLIFRTQVFREQIKSMVVGASGRKRVSAELFESLEIPVPSLHEQQSIVDQYDKGLSNASLLRTEARDVLDQAVERITSALGLRSPDVAPIRGGFVVSSHAPDRWSVFSGVSALRGIRDELESAFPVLPLGTEHLAAISYGISKSPRNRPGRDSRPYLRVANVQDGYLDLNEIKHIDVPDDQLPQFLLQSGDVLLCEGNSAELVGRPALWRGEIDGCVHQNHVLRVRCNREALLPEYLLAYMQTSPSRGHFRRRAKNTTNLSTINSTDVRELSVPMPPLAQQQAIAGIWSNARAESDRLRAEAADEENRALTETEARIVGL